MIGDTELVWTVGGRSVGEDIDDEAQELKRLAEEQALAEIDDLRESSRSRVQNILKASAYGIYWAFVYSVADSLAYAGDNVKWAKTSQSLVAGVEYIAVLHVVLNGLGIAYDVQRLLAAQKDTQSLSKEE